MLVNLKLLALKDADSKFVFVNRAFAEFAKTPAETLLGDDGAKVLAKPREPVMETDIEVLDTGETMELEVHIPDGEGRELTYLTRKARFVSETGERYLLCSTVNVRARPRICGSRCSMRSRCSATS